MTDDRAPQDRVQRDQVPPDRVIGAYFAAMRRGASAETDLLALFAPDAVYIEPFSGVPGAAVGIDQIRDRFRQGWNNPLPDLELEILKLVIDGQHATTTWECRSPGLPRTSAGSGSRYEIRKRSDYQIGSAIPGEAGLSFGRVLCLLRSGPFRVDALVMALFNRKSRTLDNILLEYCQEVLPAVSWSYTAEQDAIVGGARRVNLEKLRLEWGQLDPGDRDDWLDATVRPLIERRAHAEALNVNRVVATIRPRAVLEAGRLDSLNAGKAPEEVRWVPLTDDLCGLLVVVDKTVTTIGQTHLNSWGTTLEELWPIGLTNLKLRVGGEWLSSDGKVFCFNHRDDFTNARLLVPGFLDELPIRGPKVVFLPHRNSLIVTAVDDEAGIDTACQLAIEEAAKPGQISLTPLLFRDGKFEPLELDTNHRAWRAWRELLVLDGRLNYGATASDLQKLLGPNVLVSDFVASEHPNGGMGSQAMWAETETLLPKVDTVVFYQNDSPPKAMTASWSDVRMHCRDLMEPTEHYPMRWRVNGLPDTDLIREIGTPLGTAQSF